MGHYKKEDDLKILEQIRPIINARPTYGYKRVTAMYNRQRALIGLGRANKKRIYRIMKLNGLLLPKTERTREHRPTGKVMTLHSNTRWCLDCFEIKCFNEEKVYVSFILDCCDREAISFIASRKPLLGENIQSMMINAVEKRFGKLRTPREIEFFK
ncbi:IS3 family transposase [Bacteriovoracaceae bacterium]|nr:IS3 family transposase [Bacteriovoracaceae bacterium]